MHIIKYLYNVKKTQFQACQSTFLFATDFYPRGANYIDDHDHIDNHNHIVNCMCFDMWRVVTSHYMEPCGECTDKHVSLHARMLDKLSPMMTVGYQCTQATRPCYGCKSMFRMCGVVV